MRRIADAMATQAMGSGLFYFFENGLKMDMLAVEYQLNKGRMADLGMTLGDLTSQMDLFVSEGYVTRYDERGRAYRVIPQLQQEFKFSPESLLERR